MDGTGGAAVPFDGEAALHLLGQGVDQVQAQAAGVLYHKAFGEPLPFILDF